MRSSPTYILVFHFSVIGLIGTVVENSGETRPRCKFQEYRCSDGSACLKTEKLCNGIPDCPSGEDESWDCKKKDLNTDCGDQRKFFRCRYGGCIARNLVCNGEVDCDGGSDEASDLCGNSGLKPAPNVIPAGNKPGQGQGHQQPSRPRPTRPASTKPRPSNTPPPRPPPEPKPPAPQPPKTPVNIEPPSSGSLTCEPLEEEEGVKVKCMLRNREVDCYLPAANGTVASYECKQHFTVTQPPKVSRRMCKNGSWTKRNAKWNCVPDCGKGGRQTVGLITGGTTSQIGKWPWHVGLYHQDPPNSGKWVYFCGGTVISTRTVLTAAHCVSTRDGKVKKDIRLFFGKYYRHLRKNDEFVQERRPIDIKVNPYYSSQTFASDIAMIHIEPLDITERVQIVCLPTEGDLEAGDVGTLVGWGRYSDDRYPDELQEANLPVKSFKECQSAHPSLEALVKADSFCAGYRNGTSPCDGDSGGGLVFLDTTKRWTIYGIVSAGVAKRGGGCDPKYYTVFTRVMKFRDFIDNFLDQTLRKRRSISR